MFFSVIVPTCNRPDLLRQCLDALAPAVQTLPADRYEVIVTDDGATTSEALVAQSNPWAKWTAGPRRGPAANRNNGVRKAAGRWLAFTDDDCIPDPNWLAAFAEAIHDGRQIYEGKTVCLAGVNSPLEQSPTNLTGGCLWSCNFLIERTLFDEVGGFDENFPFPYLEDADLRDRLVMARQSYEFVPKAVVDHPPRPTTPARRLSRYHESWMYHWYKSGNRTWGTPRLLHTLLLIRTGTIFRYPIRLATFQALGSLFLEVLGTMCRAPGWERKYRYRFLQGPDGRA